MAEAHGRLPRHLAKVVGAIYVRFSTWIQDMPKTKCALTYSNLLLQWNFVPRRRYVDFDLGVEATRANGMGSIDFATFCAGEGEGCVVFATNRIFRKVYRTLCSSSRKL